MKRCPQCSFIYLDNDECCDLDGAALQHVDDSEIEPVNRPLVRVARAFGLMRSLILAATGLVILVGITSLSLYFSLRRRSAPDTIARIHTQPSTTIPLPTASTTATPLPSPSPTPTRSPSPAPVSTPVAAGRAVISQKPVSTSNDQTGRSGHALIRLTDGTTVRADEVWRTRDGIWYRRSGMVTLIKFNRVKSIEKLGRKQVPGSG